jgi:hypothetical protein
MIAGNSTRALIALTLIFSVSYFLPQRTQACGPFFSDAIFVYSVHPDFPLDTFAGGKLGVVDPGWARSYLVASYRNLSGTPFSETEAKGIKALWDDRLNNRDSAGYGDGDGVNKWTEARKQVPGVAAPAQINVYRNREKPNEYEGFLNCQQDAFENATTTLADRIKRFGADSPAVRDWLTAQDTVFANCHFGKHIPEGARADQDQLIRADRAYQIAAANFYSTGLDEAKQQFDAIARDSSSPWRDKAAYLGARSMLRKGSFADKPKEKRPALSDAENRLNAILKDNSLKAVQPAAARLLNLVRLRLHPEEAIHQLAQAIVKKDSGVDFKQSVWDYTVLLDKFLGDHDDDAVAKLPAGLTSDDLTDWIITLQDGSPAAATHSFDRWQKTKSLPWLVAAITKATVAQGNVDVLLSAAAQVNRNSPAFPSVAYRSVGLLMDSNRSAEARAMLDRILANDRQLFTQSATNLLMGQRMMLAQNLDEFLRNSQMVPAGLSDDNDGRQIPDDESEKAKRAEPLFNQDAAMVFNRSMPVAILKDSARGQTLAPGLRRDVVQAAFTRAALLDDRETANQAAVVLQELYPELKDLLAAYQKAATPDARRFAAGFMSMKHPGLRPYVSAGVGRSSPLSEIDSYRDNYWCAEPPTSPAGAASEGEDGKPKAAPTRVPDFLKASATVAARQFAALQALGTGPNYFCRMAIEWTEKNPNDPRSPEALHLAVRSTRYGCTDKETGRWSKAAYDLLHRRYPNTTWARNTKYWFK